MGLIAEKDLLLASAAQHLHEETGQYMSTSVVHYEEDSPVQAIFDFFCRSNIRRVYITHDHARWAC